MKEWRRSQLQRTFLPLNLVSSPSPAASSSSSSSAVAAAKSGSFFVKKYFTASLDLHFSLVDFTIVLILVKVNSVPLVRKIKRFTYKLSQGNKEKKTDQTPSCVLLHLANGPFVKRLKLFRLKLLLLLSVFHSL